MSFLTRVPRKNTKVNLVYLLSIKTIRSKQKRSKVTSYTRKYTKRIITRNSLKNKALKFRGTKLLENRPYLLGMPIFSEELTSLKNSWLVAID